MVHATRVLVFVAILYGLLQCCVGILCHTLVHRVGLGHFNMRLLNLG